MRRAGSSRIATRAGSSGIARRAGFTLIEVLGVLLLMTLVFGVALDTYVDLSLQTRRASSFTRDARRATALLDRVGADLAAAVLAVKPEGRDPLEHPWLFLAEARSGDAGADRLKFVTAGRPPIASASHASDLAQVALLTEAAADGSLELLRWSYPHLPDTLDRNLPRADDPRVLLLADGIESFGVRFLDESGEWSDRWDSSALARSSQLPLAVEIEVSWAPKTPGEEPTGPYTRRVVLPQRPFDLEARLTGKDPGAQGEQDEEDEEKEAEEEKSCLRVRDCVDVRALPPDLMNVVFDLMDQCLSETGIPDDVLLPECR